MATKKQATGLTFIASSIGAWATDEAVALR